MISQNRFDLIAIQDLIPQNAQLLDLGCGDGSLLESLSQSRNIQGYGLETSSDQIQSCVAKGVNVIEQNLDHGLSNFDNKSFDVVLMAQAIQELSNPRALLHDIVRVGHQGIVTFPNFGFWKNRWMLTTQGRMPESKTIPHKWYSTPNIHLCTCKDFELLCKENDIRVDKKIVLNARGESNFHTQQCPNLFGEIAIYCISAAS